MKQVRETTGIVHLRTPALGGLREFLLNADLSPLTVVPSAERVESWLHFGCVYVEGKRARTDVCMKADQIVRLHTRPKRFTVPPLRDRIVLNHEEFLVLDKPSGTPTHATLDNYVENAQFRLSAELGVPLYVTHRLDIPTRGLLILAKNRNAQAVLNRGFALGRVRKIYGALCENPAPPGLHTHYMDPESRVPKRLMVESTPGFWRCQMEIFGVTPHGLGHLHNVRLISGKTHQIRAQMAALKAPIIGDSAYGSKRAFTPDAIALECRQLTFPFRLEKFDVHLPEALGEGA